MCRQLSKLNAIQKQSGVGMSGDHAGQEILQFSDTSVWERRCTTKKRSILTDANICDIIF